MTVDNFTVVCFLEVGFDVVDFGVANFLVDDTVACFNVVVDFKILSFCVVSFWVDCTIFGLKVVDFRVLFLKIV